MHVVHECTKHKVEVTWCTCAHKTFFIGEVYMLYMFKRLFTKKRSVRTQMSQEEMHSNRDDHKKGVVHTDVTEEKGSSCTWSLEVDEQSGENCYCRKLKFM